MTIDEKCYILVIVGGVGIFVDSRLFFPILRRLEVYGFYGCPAVRLYGFINEKGTPICKDSLGLVVSCFPALRLLLLFGFYAFTPKAEAPENRAPPIQAGPYKHGRSLLVYEAV